MLPTPINLLTPETKNCMESLGTVSFESRNEATTTNLWNLELVVGGGLVLATSATGALVHLGGDGVGDVGQLLLLLLEVLSVGGGAVLLKPIGRLLDSLEDLGSMLVICR